MAGRARGYHPRAMIRKLLQIQDTPHSIALGTSLGMLIAMTPTIGIQIVIAAVVCTAFRANRVAGIVMVFISNPLTMVPIYWADYWVGAKLLGSEMISKEDFAAIWTRIIEAGMIGGIREGFVVLTGAIFLPMMLGGTLIGFVLAVPLYPITYRAVEARRRRRELRRAYLRLRELRAAGESDPPRRSVEGAERLAAAPPAAPPAAVLAGAEPLRAPAPVREPAAETVRGETGRAVRPEERLAEPEREESMR
jgi:uncharacterized protein (DUF2062 family)